MRARVASLRTTYQRLSASSSGDGAGGVPAAQEAIIDYVERIVRARLREIPDGRAGTRSAHDDHDGTNDAIYPICCRVIKQGDWSSST